MYDASNTHLSRSGTSGNSGRFSERVRFCVLSGSCRVMREASQQATDTVQRLYDDGSRGLSTLNPASTPAASGSTSAAPRSTADPESSLVDSVGDSWMMLPDDLPGLGPDSDSASAAAAVRQREGASGGSGNVDGHGADTKQQKGRRASEFAKWLLEICKQTKQPVRA